jgi:hypothetical protein
MKDTVSSLEIQSTDCLHVQIVPALTWAPRHEDVWRRVGTPPHILYLGIRRKRSASGLGDSTQWGMSPVHIEQGTCWSPQPVWTQWKRYRSHAFVGSQVLISKLTKLPRLQCVSCRIHYNKFLYWYMKIDLVCCSNCATRFYVTFRKYRIFSLRNFSTLEYKYIAGYLSRSKDIATVWTVRGSNRGRERDFPHPSRPAVGSTQPPIQWVRQLSPWCQSDRGRGIDHTTPSSAEVKERVELYLYSPSGPSWPVIGWTLPFTYITTIFFTRLHHRWNHISHTGTIFTNRSSAATYCSINVMVKHQWFVNTEDKSMEFFLSRKMYVQRRIWCHVRDIQRKWRWIISLKMGLAGCPYIFAVYTPHGYTGSN